MLCYSLKHMGNKEQQEVPTQIVNTYPAVSDLLKELTVRGIPADGQFLDLTFSLLYPNPFPIDLLVRSGENVPEEVNRLVSLKHEDDIVILLKDANQQSAVISTYDTKTRKMRTRVLAPNGFLAQAVPNDGQWEIDWRNELFPSEKQVFLFTQPLVLPVDGAPFMWGMRIHTNLADPWGLIRASVAGGIVWKG